MRIVIIGNYKLDYQISMYKFLRILYKGYHSNGIRVTIFRPPVFFGFFWNKTSYGLAKWMSYIDKWILGSVLLMLTRIKYSFNKNVYYHIIDHSNSPYLFILKNKFTLITCHDVIAIRSALGHKELYCPTSLTGRIYQKLILFFLIRATNICAVSNTTLKQLIELSVQFQKVRKNWSTIYNGLNAPFCNMSDDLVYMHLAKYNLYKDSQYILHVGSSLPRKNRILILKMLEYLKNDFKGIIVFAGSPVNRDILKYIHDNRLDNRVIFAHNPSFTELQALYSGCEALVFPSWSEGFGWPIIEAQACGAPVITSSIMPMIEIGGEGALYASPDRPDGFAIEFSKLSNSEIRTTLINNGYRNVEKFSTSEMINNYLNQFKYSM